MHLAAPTLSASCFSNIGPCLLFVCFVCWIPMTSGNFSPAGSTLGFFISNASKTVSLHLMHFCFRFSQIRLGNTIKCGSQRGLAYIYIYAVYDIDVLLLLSAFRRQMPKNSAGVHRRSAAQLHPRAGRRDLPSHRARTLLQRRPVGRWVKKSWWLVSLVAEDQPIRGAKTAQFKLVGLGWLRWKIHPEA